MAQITLYPISDVALNHSCSNGSVGYSLINDVSGSPDDNSSYIYKTYATGVTTSTVSRFGVSESSITRKFRLTALSSRVRANVANSSLSATVVAGLSINGGTESASSAHTLSTSWENKNYNHTGMAGLNQDNNSFADLNLVLQLTTSGTNSSNKYEYQVRVTQAFVTATYTPYYNCLATNAEGCSSVSTSANEVLSGSSCTFTATFPNNYTFIGWYSDFACTQLVSTSATYTVSSVDDDLHYYARAGILYTIQVYGDDYCTASVNPTKEELGNPVTATCTPNDSMKEFVGWYSNPERTNLVSTNNPYVFNVTGNTTIYARSRPKYQMYIKVNDSWELCSAVYKKVNGVWVQQTELVGLFDTTTNYIKIDV